MVPIQGQGSQPCLACLPADSSGTVSWLPAKLLPLPAGCHPGPDARGPAGGQQLERRRAVIPARRLQAGLGVGAFNRPLQPLGIWAQLHWLLALPPKLAPPQGGSVESAEQISRSSGEKSAAGQRVRGAVRRLLQPPRPRSCPESGASVHRHGLFHGLDIPPALGVSASRGCVEAGMSIPGPRPGWEGTGCC